MLKIASTALLLLTLAGVVGCNTQAKQQQKQDEEFRRHVEELKHKSNAYPVNGSHTWTHYLP